MTVSCEAFLDYAYEGNTNLPLSVRIQNAITKVIEVFQKFILKVKGIKKERVVPRKVLDAYVKLSNNVWNRMVECKSAFQSDKTPPTFSEPFDSQEYKTLFSEDVKKHTSPGEYVKIQSSVVLNRMNGVLTALTAAKNGLRSIDKESNPGKAQACTQMINYGKFMMKISNRVLSYKNMYVEKKHLQNTPIDDEEDEKKSTNESFMDFEREINLAIVTEGLFDLFKKKPQKEAVITHTKPKLVTTKDSENYKVIVSKKTAKFMKDYAKKHNFDQKYKHAIFSYPTMEIKYDEEYGVQVSWAQLGRLDSCQELTPKDIAFLKRKYGDISEDEIEEEHPELFDNKWYYEIQDVGVKYANTLSTDRFEVQADFGDGDEGFVYIDVYDLAASQSSADESYVNYASEGIFNLFKKKEKVESTPEAKKLEAEIRKKVCDHLIKYSKQSNFVNEYRKAICSFPNMEIKIVSHGVQIAKTKDGLTEPKDWPDYIKNKYYGPRIRKGTIYEKYNDAFNNKWYHELLQEGKDWCRKNCTVPDNFILQLWDDNGTENILYIEVFEKISK